MGIIENFKRRKIINEINKLNNNKLEITRRIDVFYNGRLNLNFISYDKETIKLILKNTFEF